MRRRLMALVLTTLALLAPAVPALAQGDPFGPLPPPAQPTPEPTPQPDGGRADSGSPTLAIIGGGLLVAFVGIGVWIARDARRSIPDHHRGPRAMAEPDAAEARARRKDPRTKQRARKKARAQRRARRHNR
jgi:hypothetical protein